MKRWFACLCAVCILYCGTVPVCHASIKQAMDSQAVSNFADGTHTIVAEFRPGASEETQPPNRTEQNFKVTVTSPSRDTSAYEQLEDDLKSDMEDLSSFIQEVTSIISDAENSAPSAVISEDTLSEVEDWLLNEAPSSIDIRPIVVEPEAESLPTLPSVPKSSPLPEPTAPEPTAYLIHTTSASNGSISVSHTSAVKGTIVSITLSPNTGYQTKRVSVEGTNVAGSVSVSGSGNNYTFTMPGKQVTVSAVFEKQAVSAPVSEREPDSSASSTTSASMTAPEVIPSTASAPTAASAPSTSTAATTSNRSETAVVIEEPKNPEAEYAVRKLSVNGHPVQCESYSVDGSSYFKVRDLAYLLSDTSRKFSPVLGSSSIFIRTGEPYLSQGDELEIGTSRGTESTTPVNVRLNGMRRTDIAAYQIAGDAFIRLLDLGDALGLAVDYNTETAAIQVDFDDPEPDHQFPCYLNHYGVPNFHRVVGAEPCAENALIQAYSFTALKEADHAYDCVAVYAAVLRNCGFLHTQKFHDAEGHPVALFESETKNAQVLLGSASVHGVSAMTVVLLSGNDSADPMEQYARALTTL